VHRNSCKKKAARGKAAREIELQASSLKLQATREKHAVANSFASPL
jgi:hypothetical protein